MPSLVQGQCPVLDIAHVATHSWLSSFVESLQPGPAHVKTSRGPHHSVGEPIGSGALGSHRAGGRDGRQRVVHQLDVGHERQKQEPVAEYRQRESRRTLPCQVDTIGSDNNVQGSLLKSPPSVARVTNTLAPGASTPPIQLASGKATQGNPEHVQERGSNPADLDHVQQRCTAKAPEGVVRGPQNESGKSQHCKLSDSASASVLDQAPSAGEADCPCGRGDAAVDTSVSVQALQKTSLETLEDKLDAARHLPRHVSEVAEALASTGANLEAWVARRRFLASEMSTFADHARACRRDHAASTSAACADLVVPASLQIARRAASEAYWSFGKKLDQTRDLIRGRGSASTLKA